jgi:SusD family.
MKTNKILINSLLVLTIVLASCKDSFLEVDPPTQTTIQEYYTTQEHVYQALIATYDPLEWPDWAMGQYNPVNIMSDIMADDIWVGGASKTDNQFWHLMMNYEALPNNCMTGLWTDEYSGIKRANDCIQYIGWAKDNMTEAQQKMYTAEAKVLRDYYYNNLWKFWGNIPYYTTNLQSPYYAPQITADQVYTNVITDIQEAIDMNVLPMKQESDSLGRVTKAMAYMLYTEMVMYQKDESRYATALKYMQEIISSGKYALNSDYAALWEESGEWCNESIWEINYKDDNAVRSWNGPLVAGGTVLPRLISPSSWTDGTAGVDNGWGFAPVRAETYERYSSSDKRRDATCFNAAANGKYTARYQDTGYFLYKYIARTGYNKDQKADADLNYNNNLRVYRYAECLLNTAELLLRTNGSTDDATKYLNMIRDRAGISDVTTATIDKIIEERHLEFVGEGKRYWDIVRSGKASTILVPDSYGYRTNTWSENRKYQPIPQSELDSDPNLIQNTDY